MGVFGLWRGPMTILPQTPAGTMVVSRKQQMEQTMYDARQVRIHAYGEPERMQVDTVSLPAPGDGEVLISQKAAGINFIDIYHRKGIFPIPQLPGAIGVEAVGNIVAVGPNVTGFLPGDRVAYAGPPVGSYADSRIMKASKIVKIPDKIDFGDAASLMLKGMTAHMLMTRVRPLKPGETILVHAAAGGLGSILCQWANAIGVRVIGTVGTAAKAETALALGCSDVILYKEQDFVSEVQHLTDGQGVNAVYEGVGGDTLSRSLDCLAPFGIAVNLGQVGNPLKSIDLAALGPQRSLSVAVPGVFAYLRKCPDIQAAADEMFSFVTSGKIKPKVGHRYPLENASEAHRILESGATTGAIILET